MTGAELGTVLGGALELTISAALVLIVAAVGELVQEAAGVLNLGLEGVFLSGALAGFVVAYDQGSPWLGYLAAAAAGALVGCVFAGLVVSLRMNQVVVGVLLVIFMLGLADVVWDHLFGSAPQPPRLALAEPIQIPVLSGLPILGQGIFTRSPSEYAALLLVGGVVWLLVRSRLGLVFRAAGESPDVVHFSGLSVAWIRFAAVVMGCAVAGSAGGLLTIGQLGFYAPGVTAGRGWIAIALVILGGWSPWRTMIGALVFGAAEMLQLEIQAMHWQAVPFELLIAFPYLVVIAALLLRRRAARPPSALGQPFMT